MIRNDVSVGQKPVFIKGHLSFVQQGQRFEFVHQNISTYGVSGLPWGPLDKDASFGKRVEVDVRVTGDPLLAFRTQALITRERSQGAEQMGLRFVLVREIEVRLEQRINEKGFSPTDYVRKYPRIPSNEMIQTFPLRALLRPLAKTATNKVTANSILIADVVNLSPNGALMRSQSQASMSILPGERFMITLEPRGWFPHQIEVQALACRVAEEIDPVSGNLTRLFGLKFTRVEGNHSQLYIDLLKDILIRMKAPGP